MKETDLDPLREYIDNWRSIDGVKPCNEPLFIEYFAKLLANYPDEREVEFDGEGAYFGKQVTLRPFSTYGCPNSWLAFEVAYSKDKISVYTANNQGFWWPEYLWMTSDHNEFSFIHSELIYFLRGVFGV